MTEISQLLAKINMNPASLVQMDWDVETNCFSKERIRQLIDGVTDNEVCQVVGDFIIEAWYDACEGDDPSDALREVVGWDIDGRNIYKYRFYSERGNFSSGLASIEDFIAEKQEKRERKQQRIERLNRLQMKTDRELGKLRPKLEKTEGLAKQTNHKTRKRFSLAEQFDDVAEFIKLAEIEYKREAYAKEKIIEMLHHFIQFGEKYPSNMNAKGEAIREVIDDYLRVHPDSLLDEEWCVRLQELGRKENHIQIGTLKAENLYDVHDNKTVKL